MEFLYSSPIGKLYQDYGPRLYLIALEIAPDQITAEKILVDTFLKIRQQQFNRLNEHQHLIYITLIKLLLQTAQEHLSTHQSNAKFELKQFEHTPLLHKLICEQISLEDYCKENHLSRTEAAHEIRKEVMLLRKAKSEKLSLQKHNNQ